MLGFVQVKNVIYRWSKHIYHPDSLYRTSLDETAPDLETVKVTLKPYKADNFSAFIFGSIIGTIVKNKKVFVCMTATATTPNQCVHIIFLDRDTLLNGMKTYIPFSRDEVSVVFDKYLILFHRGRITVYNTETEKESDQYLQDMPVCSPHEHIGNCFCRLYEFHSTEMHSPIFVIDGVICLVSKKHNMVHYFILKEGSVLYVGTTDFTDYELGPTSFAMNGKLLIEKSKTPFLGTLSEFDVLI